MKYIVYLTINTCNNKFYIGVHGTADPNVFDGYIGNGVYVTQPSTYKYSKTHFQYAVNKYGVKSFKRIILRVFDTADDAYNLEEYLVDTNFIKRKDTYNMVVGGRNGVCKSHIEIYQYSLEGKFIKQWTSIAEAASFCGVSTASIYVAYKHNTTSCGHLWSINYYDQLDISKYIVHKTNTYVYKFDNYNNIVAIFDSAAEAAKEAKSGIRLILRSISEGTKSKGFYYSYDKHFKKDNSTYKKLSSIYLYNLDGSFFKEFNSPRECADYFSDIKTSRLYSAARIGGLYHHYQVSTVKLDSMKNIEVKNDPKSINQYDLNDNFIKKWDTIQSAVNEYGTGVKKCLKGVLQTCKGFKFKYAK